MSVFTEALLEGRASTASTAVLTTRYGIVQG